MQELYWALVAIRCAAEQAEIAEKFAPDATSKTATAVLADLKAAMANLREHVPADFTPRVGAVNPCCPCDVFKGDG